jgi:hypothetical protein
MKNLTKEDFARLIMQMNYGTLLGIATALVDMNAEGQRDVKTDHGMAETLFDWAEYVTEEAELEASQIHAEAAE